MTPSTFPSTAGQGPRALTQDETIEWLLNTRSQRRNRTVPLRRLLVQGLAEDGPRRTTTPGPLSKLMRSPAALDLLLLVHAVASGGDFGVAERSETWARATGVSFVPGASASAAISRLWHKLEQLNLVARSTSGRLTKVTKLLEDGSGRPYTRPAGSEDLGEIYFQVPYQYWDEGFHKKLDTAGKAVMLIGMSLRKKQFALPQTKDFAAYYGISKSTLERGLDQLIETGLLNRVGSEQYITGDTATGTGERILYGFRPPFDLNVRKPKAKKAAPKTERRKVRTSSPPFDFDPQLMSIFNGGTPKPKTPDPREAISGTASTTATTKGGRGVREWTSPR